MHWGRDEECILLRSKSSAMLGCVYFWMSDLVAHIVTTGLYRVKVLTDVSYLSPAVTYAEVLTVKRLFYQENLLNIKRQQS
jgi:hypothetical protein